MVEYPGHGVRLSRVGRKVHVQTSISGLLTSTHGVIAVAGNYGIPWMPS